VDISILKRELPAILAHEPEVQLVYLYGSQVTGHTGPASDVDLGVYVDRAADGQAVCTRFAHAIATLLGTDRVDVVLLNHTPVELAYAVIAQGERLYERDVATRVEYEAYVMGRYGDYLPVLRAQRAAILEGDRDGTRARRYREAFGRTERTLDEIRAAYQATEDSV
jgi:predicted nucleotidyltransferase